MILDFGKHRDIDIQEVPLEYMIFLSGYRMHHTQRIPTDIPAYDWVKTNHEDWEERYLHKSCWKLLKKQEEEA